MKYGTTLDNFKGKLTGDINKKSGAHIDYIYVKNGASVSRVEIVEQKGSDHLPVEADIVL